MTGIWSEEAGDASHPLIAIVHGAMERSAGMLKLSRRLDERYRVLRYDRRGYGLSNPHPGPFGIDAQVADLVDLLAGRRAVVVGHSYGGNVALATACRHPELVAGVGLFWVLRDDTAATTKAALPTTAELPTGATVPVPTPLPPPPPAPSVN